MISIITITYNDESNLIRTLRSVRKNKKDFQKYFIIDGNSKDNTVKLLLENNDIIDNWISETDDGIYSAMNKVEKFLEIDDEDYILWLNAGDELLDWDQFIINRIIDYDCYFFSVIAKFTPTSNGKVIASKILIPLNEKNYMPLSIYRHQGFLVKLKVFRKYYYNTKVGINADGLLMSHCIMNEHFSSFNYPISIFYLDGISNTHFSKSISSYLKVYKELNLKLYKLLFYQRAYFIKTITKMIIPFFIIKVIRRIKDK